MKKLILALCLLSSTALAQPMTQPSLAPLPDLLTRNGTRACIFQPGAWTAIACTTAAAAETAALNAWSRYVLQCADDSYFRTGTSAATAAATASDGWLPMGTWLPIFTTNTIKYVGCLNKNNSVGCVILECK